MAKRPVFVITDDSLLTEFTEHFNSPTTTQHITATKNYDYHGNVRGSFALLDVQSYIKP